MIQLDSILRFWELCPSGTHVMANQRLEALETLVHELGHMSLLIDEAEVTAIIEYEGPSNRFSMLERYVSRLVAESGWPHLTKDLHEAEVLAVEVRLFQLLNTKINVNEIVRAASDNAASDPGPGEMDMLGLYERQFTQAMMSEKLEPYVQQVFRWLVETSKLGKRRK